ncbi:MAG: recombinase family protein [Undibacterium sp.]|uniref:recombinase family protein n=1 Tax=Undibacterium sp. TaxID=1914977 RepID=UPI0027166059|nr:recombinase family protein [Undibacterium sp.]MDO8652025.1 recombinase family protein [Undibacterium sp.]
MSTGQQLAYIRVSTITGNTARQLDGMTFDLVFEDKVSGKDTNRPQLQAMKKHARTGDTIHIHEISRLARNTSDLLKLVEEFTGKGVTLIFHKENLTFTGGANNPMNTLMLTLLGAVASFERSLINERSAEGRAVSKKHQGRKDSLTLEQQAQIRARQSESKVALAEEYGVSRATIYNTLKTA